jgi:two-component system sensor histidine kinase HydH
LAGVLALLLAVLAVTTFARLHRGRELMLQSYHHQAMILVQSLEGASRAAMRRGMWRRAMFRALVEEMAQHPPVKAITVYGPGGRVLARGRNRAMPQGTGGGEELPPRAARKVAALEPVNLRADGELVLGQPFDPLRRFRAQGRGLPAWACPMDDEQPGGGQPGPGSGARMGPGRMGPGMMGPGFRRPPPEAEAGGPQGYSLVRMSTAAFQEAARRAIWEAVLLGVAMFVGAGAVAWGLWAAVRRRDREVARLRREVGEHQHLAAVGRLAGSVAHEVRNPLSAVRGLVQYLAKGEEPGSRRAEYAAAAVSEVDRLERVVSGLLEYTRPREPRRIGLDLGESLASVAGLMSDDPRAQGVEIALEVPEGLPAVSADPDQVRQVLVNLLVNALEALDGRGRVEVAAGSAGGRVEVTVDDDGPGLPEGDPEQLFDPFYSTRERGTGLGLALARRIARAHGGELSAGPSPAGGARFTLVLPTEGS